MSPEEQLRAWLRFGYECAHIERDDVAGILAALDAARAEAQRERAFAVRMRDALIEYGEHWVKCGKLRTVDATRPCTCGLADDMAAASHDRIERGEHEEEVRGG